jgi:hypothetical protein
MTSRTSLSRSIPELKLFPRYRDGSPDLTGPYLSIGNCLEPWLSDGGQVWFDRLEPRAGDLVMFDYDDWMHIKQLEQLHNGSWWLVSTVMAVPLQPRWRLRGVIVAALNYAPDWPHPYPEYSEFNNARNAAVKRALAEKFEMARRLRQQGLAPEAIKAAVVEAARNDAARALRQKVVA